MAQGWEGYSFLPYLTALWKAAAAPKDKRAEKMQKVIDEIPDALWSQMKANAESMWLVSGGRPDVELSIGGHYHNTLLTSLLSAATKTHKEITKGETVGRDERFVEDWSGSLHDSHVFFKKLLSILYN
ncbi:MAG: hypothetical protein D6698_15865, partial [Gammaproteobacteria bacterium]